MNHTKEVVILNFTQLFRKIKAVAAINTNSKYILLYSLNRGYFPNC